MSRMLRTAVLGVLALVGSALWLVNPAVARPPQVSGRVQCESQARRHTYCRTGAYGRVLLERRLSDASCREYDTWGADRDGAGVWVRDGCRAVFVVQAGAGPATDRRQEILRSGLPANPRVSSRATVASRAGARCALSVD